MSQQVNIVGLESGQNFRLPARAREEKALPSSYEAAKSEIGELEAYIAQLHEAHEANTTEMRSVLATEERGSFDETIPAQKRKLQATEAAIAEWLYDANQRLQAVRGIAMPLAEKALAESPELKALQEQFETALRLLGTCAVEEHRIRRDRRASGEPVSLVRSATSSDLVDTASIVRAYFQETTNA